MIELPNYQDYLRGQESLPPLGARISKEYADLITSQRDDSFIAHPHASRVVRTMLEDNILTRLALHASPTSPLVESLFSNPYSTVKDFTRLEPHEWLVLQFSVRKFFDSYSFPTTTKIKTITEKNFNEFSDEIAVWFDDFLERVESNMPYERLGTINNQVSRLQRSLYLMTYHVGGDFFGFYTSQSELDQYNELNTMDKVYKQLNLERNLTQEDRRSWKKLGRQIYKLINNRKMYITPAGIDLFTSLEANALLGHRSFGRTQLAWVQQALGELKNNS